MEVLPRPRCVPERPDGPTAPWTLWSAETPFQQPTVRTPTPARRMVLQELPMPTSRVTLEPRVQDRYGMPAVRLLGEGPHDEDLRAAEFMVEQARDWLRARGSKRIQPVRLIYPK